MVFAVTSSVKVYPSCRESASLHGKRIPVGADLKSALTRTVIALIGAVQCVGSWDTP